MLPRRMSQFTPEWATYEEFQALLIQRRSALDTFTAKHYQVDHYPVPWRLGWRSELRYVGRSKDGSLLAKIVVTGPTEGTKWTQRVRLIPAARLNLR